MLLNMWPWYILHFKYNEVFLLYSISILNNKHDFVYNFKQLNYPSNWKLYYWLNICLARIVHFYIYTVKISGSLYMKSPWKQTTHLKMCLWIQFIKKEYSWVEVLFHCSKMYLFFYQSITPNSNLLKAFDKDMQMKKESFHGPHV